MIVISGNIVLSPSEVAASFDHPLIGWRNVITASGITADTEDANYPASNLANPSTFLEWHAADTTEQYIRFETNEVDPIDYVGIAKHNLSSGAVPVTVEGSSNGTDWDELVAEVMLPDDGPAMLVFTAASYSDIRLKFGSGLAAPRAAVVYIGKMLMMERKVYVGHTPLPQARKSNITTARSETGNFLGRIVLGEWRETSVPFSLITPAWYRANMDPFLAVSKEVPFFFAWRPDSYPREVGFCWMTDDPQPTPNEAGNLIALALNVSGVA